MPLKKQASTLQRSGSGSLAQGTLGFSSKKAQSVAARKSQSKDKVVAPAPKSIVLEDDAVKTGSSTEPEAVKTETATAPDVLKTLNVNDKRWNKLHAETKKAMGGLAPINDAEDSNKITNCLRTFDLTAKYGPCTGMSRLARWERAERWGLKPPTEVKEILTTKEGTTEGRYRESVLSTYA